MGDIANTKSNCVKIDTGIIKRQAFSIADNKVKFLSGLFEARAVAPDPQHFRIGIYHLHIQRQPQPRGAIAGAKGNVARATGDIDHAAGTV